MRNLTEENLTEAVRKKLDGATDVRFKQIMSSLVKHLHGFVREVQLTESEWFTAIQFLTATGQKCDDKRQEFILLSDTLGVSMLVDAINHRSASGATESTVQGPFYVTGGPEMPLGADIADGVPGDPTYFSGQVNAANGKPVPAATLDLWSTDGDGWYDMQLPGQGMRARQDQDRRARALRFLDCEAGELPGTHRRTGGQDAAHDGASPLPAGAYASDSVGARLQIRHHSRVRGRRSVSGIGRSVRREEFSRRGFSEARTWHCTRRKTHGQAVFHREV